MSTLRVTDGYQVNHKGTVYQGGETFEGASPSETKRFLEAGWAEEVKASKADDSKSSPKKTTSKGDA